jgi:hypothetical protein
MDENGESAKKIEEKRQTHETEVLETEEIISDVFEFTVPGEIPIPDRHKYLAVEVTDWERIEKHLSNLKPVSSLYPTVLGASLSLLGSSILAWIGISYIPNLPYFVLPSILFLLGVSLIGSILLWIFMSKTKESFNASVELITDEIKNIRKKNNSL